MAKGYLGIEFGSARLKMAEIKNGRLVKFVKEDMPENIIRDGEIVSWDALSEFLKGVLKENKFSTNRVALVVPDNLTYTRRMSLPLMTAAQLKVNLPYEFHDFISDEKDAYIYDYAVIGIEQDENGNDTGMDVLGVAVSKELMNNYRLLFKACRLKLMMAAPQCLAFSALVRHLNPEVASHDYAILDLGFSSSRINIFSEGLFDTNRTIELGCAAIARRVADLLGCDEHIAALHMVQNTNNVMDSEQIRDLCGDIAVDVMRAMNYYNYEKRDNTLENIYVCGGGALIPQLIEELSENVPLQIVQLAELANDDVEPDALTNGPAAVGICWNEE